MENSINLDRDRRDGNDVNSSIQIVMETIYTKKSRHNIDDNDIDDIDTNKGYNAVTNNNKSSMLVYAIIQCLTSTGTIGDIMQAFSREEYSQAARSCGRSVDISFLSNDIVSLLKNIV